MSSVEKKRKHIAEIFKQNVIDFIDVLIEYFPDIPKLVVGRILVSSQDDLQIIKIFIKNVHVHSDDIKNRNETFIHNVNVGFFEDGTFHDLWETIQDQDKNIVWQWFDIFDTMCFQYNSIS